MNRRMLVPTAVLAAVVAWPLAAFAQPVDHGRGKIISINQAAHTVELQDPKGRTQTWSFVPDATVKFTDQTNFYPNPTVNDLRPPMYCHFTFVKNVIQTFDVVEVGFAPGSQGSGASDKVQGRPRTVTGNVTSYSSNVRQVELDVNGRRETFQLTERSNQPLNRGDRVELNTDWSGNQELVTQVRVLGSGGNTGNRPNAGSGRGSTQRNPAGYQGQSGSSAQGRVVQITPSGVVMQVAGSQQTYAVDNAQLLQRLRVGDTVRFDWRTDRNGQMYITNVR